MHEEVKKSTTAAFLVNYSMSAGSEAPINSIVTADDLIDDGHHAFDDMHRQSRSFHTVTGFDSQQVPENDNANATMDPS